MTLHIDVSCNGSARRIKPSWMLDGECVVKDDQILNSHYTRDSRGMDALTAGQKVRVSIEADATLHFWLNDKDLGVAARDIPVEADLWALVDVYGQTEVHSSVLK